MKMKQLQIMEGSKMTDLISPPKYNPKDLKNEDIKLCFCPKATNAEIQTFKNICVMTGLNPYLREIYLIKYKDDQPASIVTGYESYLRRAESSNQWNGYKVWTEGEGDEMIAKINIWRKDWKEPFEHDVSFKEYAQYKTDYQTKTKTLTRFWAEKPRTMIKKVAISQGFRLAFPKETAGLPYIIEELNNIPTPVEPSKSPQEFIEAKESGEDVSGILTENQAKLLLKDALDNGWTRKDFKEFCEKLKISFPEKGMPAINLWDSETIKEHFSQKKTTQEA